MEIKFETGGGTMVGFFLGTAVLGVVFCYVVTSSPACVPTMQEKEEKCKKSSYINGRREGIRRLVYSCVQYLHGLSVCAGKQTKQGQVSSYPLSKC